MPRSYTFPTLLATTSGKKAKEWNAFSTEVFGSGTEFTVLDAKVSYVELEGLDPIRIAATKALDAWAKNKRQSLLVENSSFMIRHFKQDEYYWPGPQYANVEHSVGNPTLCTMVPGETDRYVTARIDVSWVDEQDPGTIHIVWGELHGEMPSQPLFLPTDPTGAQVFGYDGIICPIDAGGKSIAQLGPEWKAKNSMRRIVANNLESGDNHITVKAETSPLWHYLKP